VLVGIARSRHGSNGFATPGPKKQIDPEVLEFSTGSRNVQYLARAPKASPEIDSCAKTERRTWSSLG
jgi:hypothetical protein